MKIDDIARLANVSKSAVSLALNGKPGVSEETRKTILSIVDEYNYVPLRKIHKKNGNDNKPTKLIRFLACKNRDIITDNYQSLPFFNQLIGSLVEESIRYAYSLLLSTVDGASITDELAKLEKEQKSDAIILLGTNLSQSQILEVKKIQNKLLVIDTCYPQIDIDFITMNNYQGAYAAAQHILDNGHTSIGYAMSKSRFFNFNQRQRGFFDTLNKADITINDRFILEFPGMEIQEQSETFAYLKDTSDLPTVFFCENDYIAISLIKTLTNLGLSVPEDVSIIGFDDIPESRAISPELTTIHVPKKQIASSALKRVTEFLSTGLRVNSQLFINTELVERDSFIPFN